MTTGTQTRPASEPVLHDAHLPVVLGVDDLTDNTQAILWAVEEAHARKAPLTVVHGYTWASGYPRRTADDSYIIAGLRTDSVKLVDAVEQEIRGLDETVEVSAEAVEAFPPDLLVEHSRDAALVVLGNAHRGAMSRMFFGSVGSQVASRAEGPVVVVCGPTPDTGGTGVVAGIKPDETAQPVLAFAFEHAARHGLGVRAVLCWRPTGLADAQPMADRADACLSEALAGWRQEYPQVPVTTLVKHDHAAPVLLTEAVDAHLLVVGRHGRTPLLGAVLGSVSQAVVHHATRPVAIVPVALEE